MKLEFFRRKEAKPSLLHAPNNELCSNAPFFSALSPSVESTHPFAYCYTQTQPHYDANNNSSGRQAKQNLMQRLSNWFEDHLPLRGRRTDNRRADSVTRNTFLTAQSKARNEQKSKEAFYQKTSRSAAPPRLRYPSASCDMAGRIYPYGTEKKRRSGDKEVASREEPAINYFKEYRHREYDSDEEDDDDDEEEEEFLLITSSGYAAAAARPQMASSLYAKSSPKDIVPHINGLSQSFTTATGSGAGSSRQTIRTNPWIVRDSDERLSSRSSCSAFHPPTRVAGIAGRNNSNLQASMSLRRPTPVQRMPSVCQGNRTEQHLALPVKNGSGISGVKAEDWNLYASINRAANLNGLKALDESTCSASSGYGSQDSSPESSVHSPDWQPPSSLSSSTVGATSTCSMSERDKAIDFHSTSKEPRMDHRNDKNGKEARNEHMDKRKSGNYEKVNDEHIYHELECLNRLSLLLDDEQNIFNSELSSVAGSSYRLSQETANQSPTYQRHQREPSSPIYAVPYEASSHVRVFDNKDRPSNNDHYQQVKPIYRDFEASSLRPSNFRAANDNINQPSNNNFAAIQQALQISSPFYSSYHPGPDGYHQQSYNYNQVPRTGLRTGIIVRAQPSISDSSSEDEPEEVIIEEGDQSSTSCSSWTPMLISPRPEFQQRPCHFNAPPPPPVQHLMNGRSNEFDFLAELDQQIVELQHQSDSVRQLVEQAKERHELRTKTRQLCMEHLKELRKMRWFMHNNFELCL